MNAREREREREYLRNSKQAIFKTEWVKKETGRGRMRERESGILVFFKGSLRTFLPYLSDVIMAFWK